MRRCWRTKYTNATRVSHQQADVTLYQIYLPLVAEPATTTRLPLRVRAFV